jgi:glycosyltransferase involved in cell wall biosynthesis
MDVLFLHQNFPAQFGPVASRLAARPGYRCHFAHRTGAGAIPGVGAVRFEPAGGATARTHYYSRTFENQTWQSYAAYAALRARPDVRPDLIVAHSGFVSPLPLRELYPAAKVLGYFEWFYHARGADLDFRPEWPAGDDDRVRARFRNAMQLLDLHGCDAGYSPTEFQRSRFPAEYQGKLRVAFDGVDTAVWHPRGRTPRRAGRIVVPDHVELVTYAARGFEAMRGFDVFMRFAKALYSRRPNVRFVVIGRDRVHYGGDLNRTGGKSFKEWVLARDEYDLSKFAFVGAVPPDVLAAFFSITDLHVYLTVPFVLSWSLVNALACGATVLASDTDPVREVVADGRTGLLADFFDAEGMADRACRVLDDPAGHRPLGLAGVELVREKYSLDVCLPRLVDLYETAAGRPPGSAPP